MGLVLVMTPAFTFVMVSSPASGLIPTPARLIFELLRGIWILIVSPTPLCLFRLLLQSGLCTSLWFLYLLLIRGLLAGAANDCRIQQNRVWFLDDLEVLDVVHFEARFLDFLVGLGDLVHAVPAALSAETLHVDERHRLVNRVYLTQDAFVAHLGYGQDAQFASEDVLRLQTSVADWLGLSLCLCLGWCLGLWLLLSFCC